MGLVARVQGSREQGEQGLVAQTRKRWLVTGERTAELEGSMAFVGDLLGQERGGLGVGQADLGVADLARWSRQGGATESYLCPVLEGTAGGCNLTWFLWPHCARG